MLQEAGLDHGGVEQYEPAGTVPAWMLDPVICARTVIGEPPVNLEALISRHSAAARFQSVLGWKVGNQRGD